MAQVLDRSKRVLLRHGAVGIAFSASVSPAGEGWAASSRVLSAAPSGLDVGDFRVVRRPTRRKIASSVGALARYPKGMMYGDPALARQALEARRGYKLLRFCGVFSKNSGPRLPLGQAGESPETRFLDL